MTRNIVTGHNDCLPRTNESDIFTLRDFISTTVLYIVVLAYYIAKQNVEEKILEILCLYRIRRRGK